MRVGIVCKAIAAGNVIVHNAENFVYIIIKINNNNGDKYVIIN